MNATVEQDLIAKIKALSPQQVAEVEDFVEFLSAKSRKRAAFDRLLAVAPALGAAGVQPMSDDEITAEVKAARQERLVRTTRGSRVERNGVPLLPARRGASPVTMELVNQLRDEAP